MVGEPCCVAASVRDLCQDIGKAVGGWEKDFIRVERQGVGGES